MADKLKVGVLYGSDADLLPEEREGFGGLSLNLRGNNDLPRLIDANHAEVVPLLMAPNYLSRRWRYDLARFDVIFCALADPDINATSLLLSISMLAGAKTPVVNDPRNIIRTRRDIAAGLLRGLPGLLVPRTVRLEPGQKPSEIAGIRGLNYPLLIRSAGSHTGVGLVRAETAAELDAAMEAGTVVAPAYLTEFVDTRGEDGLYRKMRLMVCGKTVLMRHHLFFDQWQVHAAAQSFMEERPELLEYERKVAAEPLQVLPAQGAQLMTAIKTRIGLDYFGIDCARMPDGRLAVFEVNAVMNMLPASRHPGRGPFTVAAIGRIASDINALLRERGKARPPGRPPATAKRAARRRVVN